MWQPMDCFAASPTAAERSFADAQWVNYGLWLVLEVAIAATDLAEVIGSATAIYLLSNGAVPLWAGVLITAVDVLLILVMGTRNFRALELLVAALIALIAGIFACALLPVTAWGGNLCVLAGHGGCPSWLLSSSAVLLSQLMCMLGSVRLMSTACWCPVAVLAVWQRLTQHRPTYDVTSQPDWLPRTVRPDTSWRR